MSKPVQHFKARMSRIHIHDKLAAAALEVAADAVRLQSAVPSPYETALYAAELYQNFLSIVTEGDTNQEAKE